MTPRYSDKLMPGQHEYVVHNLHEESKLYHLLPPCAFAAYQTPKEKCVYMTKDGRAGERDG